MYVYILTSPVLQGQTNSHFMSLSLVFVSSKADESILRAKCDIALPAVNQQHKTQQ